MTLGIVFIGLTFLISALFPFFGMLAPFVMWGVISPRHMMFNPEWVQFAGIVTTLLPGAIVAVIVMLILRLPARLPKSPPGRAAMFVGILFFLIHYSLSVAASGRHGEALRPLFELDEYFPFAAFAFVLWGAARMLLSAKAAEPKKPKGAPARLSLDGEGS
jgi:hypothetical protein